LVELLADERGSRAVALPLVHMDAGTPLREWFKKTREVWGAFDTTTTAGGKGRAWN
jgi:hypothetical protein